MICHDFVPHSALTPDLVAGYIEFANELLDVLTPPIISVSFGYTGSKFIHCFEFIDNTKLWLSLWLSLAQFGLFHFVFFTLSRIFFMGM